MTSPGGLRGGAGGHPTDQAEGLLSMANRMGRHGIKVLLVFSVGPRPKKFIDTPISSYVAGLSVRPLIFEGKTAK